MAAPRTLEERTGFNVSRDQHGIPTSISLTNYALPSDTDTEAISLPLESIWTRNILNPHPWYSGNSRITLLDKIHASLQNPEMTPTVLSAMDGMGKTDTARMYLKKYGTHYKYRIWITASSPEHVKLCFSRVAEQNMKLSLKYGDGTLKKFDYLLQQIYLALLKTRANDRDRDSFRPKNCLLIFDDADLASIQAFLPTCLGAEEVKPAILITANIGDSVSDNNDKSHRSWSKEDYSILQLDKLNIDDIIQFIEEHVDDIKRRSTEIEAKVQTGQDADHFLQQHNLHLKEEALKLQQICGGFPLALHQAVRYINLKNNQYRNGPKIKRLFRRSKQYYTISQFAHNFKTGKIFLNNLPNFLHHGNKHESDDPNSGYQSENIFLTWDLLLKKIVKESKFSRLAIDVLKTIQLLNCDSGTPDILIYTLYPKYERRDLNEALGLLCKYGVIREHECKYFSMHRIFRNMPVCATVPINSVEDGIAERDIMKELLPLFLRLVTDEEYRTHMFEVGSLWKINLLQVYSHLSSKSAPSPLTKKDSFWLHADHCSISNSNSKDTSTSCCRCPAYELFTVLLSGLVVQELYEVLNQIISKSDDYIVSSQWSSLKRKNPNFDFKKSNSISNRRASQRSKSGGKSLTLTCELLSSQIPEIPNNPPIQLMITSLTVVTLGKEKHSATQINGLALFFKAFREYLRKSKNVEFSQEIISQFYDIVGTSEDAEDDRYKQSGTSRSRVPVDNTDTGCGFFSPSSRLREENSQKPKNWIETIALFLREFKFETAGENIKEAESDDPCDVERHFPTEFVDATEQFLKGAIIGQKNNPEEIFIWFTWLYHVFQLAEEDYPDNSRLVELLGEVTELNEAITHEGFPLERDNNIFPLFSANLFCS